MNHDLSHLPAAKRRDLEHIVAVLRDQFEQVTAFSGGKKKQGKIQKIILFGSHATGRWVDKPATGYVSDYGILVIVNQQALADDLRIWNTAGDTKTAPRWVSLRSSHPTILSGPTLLIYR